MLLELLRAGNRTYCALDVDELKRFLPDQHGQAAQNIAAVCQDLL
jgi:hypothetical protein